MRTLMPALLIGASIALSAQNRDEDVSHRFGLNLQVMVPTDTAGKLYKTGYSVGIPIYFRQGEKVEGRLRMEVGRFEGKSRKAYYGYETISANTRFVGYDWLVRLGAKRDPGVDFLIGIGGSHWYQTRTAAYPAGDHPPYPIDSDYGSQLAFTVSVGFIFHLNRHVGIEAKQMLTSLPGSNRDFTDAELSHTSVGMAFRF